MYNFQKTIEDERWWDDPDFDDESDQIDQVKLDKPIGMTLGQFRDTINSICEQYGSERVITELDSRILEEELLIELEPILPKDTRAMENSLIDNVLLV